MKKLVMAFSIFGLLFLIAACGSDESKDSSSGSVLEQLKKDGKVKVGFANENPFAYEDEKGELKGAAVEIATQALNNLGIEEVEGHLSEFGSLIPGLYAGKFDLITAGMSITPDRCENVSFGEPEFQSGGGLIVETGNPMELKSYKDVAANPDITIASRSGATEIDFLKREGVDESQIMKVPDMAAALSAVESGRAHTTTATEIALTIALESSNQDKLEIVNDFIQPELEGVPGYSAAAFRIEDDEFREAYNTELAKLKEEGKIADLIIPSGFNAETNIVDVTLTTESICSGENY